MNVTQLQDYLNVTRSTELSKGDWVSLSSDLPSYPLSTVLLDRTTRRSSEPVTFTIAVNAKGNVRYGGVGNPIQGHSEAITKRASVELSIIDGHADYSVFEPELQGTDEEQLNDIILMRKVEQLDQPILSFREHAFAGSGGTSADTTPRIYGLKYWFPEIAPASLTENLTLNGGGNPSGHSSGAANLTVADAPRWAHAVGKFSNISDDDLFATLHEFRLRNRYHVPEGARPLDSPMADRIILANHAVVVEWGKLQVVANDNPQRDLGRFRTSVDFMSTPVMHLPVTSEPDSEETPDSYGLLYDLDLNTLVNYRHSAFDYELRVLDDEGNVPDVRKLYRVGKEQLICKNREKNLVMTTATAGLIT